MTDLKTSRPAALFDADPDRIERLDLQWRRRLSESLTYLGEALAARGFSYGSEIGVATAAIDAKPVSPWITGLYSKLVADLATGETDFGKTLAALVAAAKRPARIENSIVIDDESVPPLWWTHYRQLIDTDDKRRLQPVVPAPEVADDCRRSLEAGMSALERAAPAYYAEVRSLARIIVLAVPESDLPAHGFGAGSTFFMRETLLINAAASRNAMEAVDVLVHETSHILLFSLAMNQALTTDRGEARFASAARSDPRPIDGIFHAAFVSTRVHLVLTRMIASGVLTAEQLVDAERQRAHNERVATRTLQTVLDQASPTEVGREILDALADYWDVPGRSADAA